MAEFKIHSDYRAHGRPAAGHRRADRGRAKGLQASGAPGRHRLGQDLHHGQHHQKPRPPGAGHRPQQDAGGAVGRGVPRVFPRERRGLLRQLLRLLPARGLHPVHGHLHRKGLLRQRTRSTACATAPPRGWPSGATWSSSPRSAASTAWATRRNTRASPSLCARAWSSTATSFCAGSWRYSTSATTFEQERGSFRVRGDVVEIIPAASNEKALRIELFGDEIERIAEVEIVSGHVLRYLAHVMIFPASHYATSRDKLERCIENIENDLKRPPERVQGRGETARSAAPRTAHAATTSKCCARSATAPASKTIPATSTAARPGKRRSRCWTTFPGTSSSSSTNRTPPSRRYAPCTTATPPASARWWTTASACRRRSTTAP